eukprot:g18417.t1
MDIARLFYDAATDVPRGFGSDHQGLFRKMSQVRHSVNTTMANAAFRFFAVFRDCGVQEDAAAGAVMKSGGGAGPSRTGGTVRPVPLVALSTVINTMYGDKHHLDFELLKIDAQGFDWQVFQSVGDGGLRPNRVVMEAQDVSDDSLVSLYASSGMGSDARAGDTTPLARMKRGMKHTYGKKAEEQDADGPSAADLQRNPNASPLNTEKLELHPLTLTEQQISETVRSAVQILMGEDGAQLRAIVLEEMQKPNAVLAYYEPGRPDKAAKIVLSDENNAVRVVGGGQGGEDPFSKRLLARFEAVPSGKYMPMVNSAVSFEENKKLVLDNLLNQQLKNMFLMPDVKSALESAVKGGLPMPRQRMVQSDDQTKLVNDPGANILAQEAAKLGQQQPQAGSAGGLAGGAAGGESPVREAVVNPDAVGAGGAASTSGAFLQEGGAAASEAAKTAPPASAQAPQESQQKFVSWSVKRDDTASAEHYAADALYVAGNMLMLSKVAGLDSDTPGALTLLDAAPGDVAETPQQLVEEKKDLDKSPSLSVVDFIGAWGDGGGAPFRSTPGGNGAAASASASSSSYNDRVEDFVSGARLLLIAEDQSQLHKSISAGAAGEMKDPENPADGDPQPNLAGDVIREVAQEWGTIFAQRLQNQREGKNAQPFLRLCEQTAVFSTSLSAENASWCKEALGAGGSNKKDAFAHLRRALTSAEGAKSRNAQPEAGARKQQAETDHAAEETQKALDAMEDARKKQKQVKALEEADNPGEDQPWTSTSSALVEASPGEAENRGRLKSEGRHKQESTREDGLQDDEAPRKTSQGQDADKLESLLNAFQAVEDPSGLAVTGLCACADNSLCSGPQDNEDFHVKLGKTNAETEAAACEEACKKMAGADDQSSSLSPDEKCSAYNFAPSTDTADPVCYLFKGLVTGTILDSAQSNVQDSQEVTELGGSGLWASALGSKCMKYNEVQLQLEQTNPSYSLGHNNDANTNPVLEALENLEDADIGGLTEAEQALQDVMALKGATDAVGEIDESLDLTAASVESIGENIQKLSESVNLIETSGDGSTGTV